MPDFVKRRANFESLGGCDCDIPTPLEPKEWAVVEYDVDTPLFIWDTDGLDTAVEEINASETACNRVVIYWLDDPRLYYYAHLGWTKWVGPFDERHPN